MPRIDLIQLRRDTEANLLAVDPILALAESLFITDTYELIVGDGVSVASSLDRFAVGGGGGGGGDIASDVIWNAAGDTVQGTGSNTAARLGIGAALSVYCVNAGATALQWVVSSGTGSLVRATSPTLVTPALGTPTALVLTNATGLPNASVIGLGSAALVDTSAFDAAGSAAAAQAAAIAASMPASRTKAQLDAAISDGNILYVGDVTSGYTNLNQFVAQTAWRVFYADAAGDVIELALGADGTFLKSNGAAAAPSFAAPSGAGDALVAATLDQFADVTQTATKTLDITESTTLAGGTHSGTNTGDQDISGKLNASLVSAAALTVLDDATVAAIVDTLGAAASTGTGGLVRATNPLLIAPRTTEIIQTPSGANPAVSITLANGANQTLALTSATGTAAVTLIVPASSMNARLIVKQHATTQVDLTFASAASITWIGTEPDWVADAVGTRRILSISYDGTAFTLAVTGPTGIDPAANLTGPITSVGTATSIASQTGTGTTFAMSVAPAFTGAPTAPTAAAATNTTQLATTQFVRTELANLVDSSPGTLDTLNELAAALGDDASFATTIAASLATKLEAGGALGTPSSGTATNLTGTAAGLTAGIATAANALNSATTTVVVNAATAPTIGQVLTATSGTAANWQTPSGGSGSGWTDVIRTTDADLAAAVNTWYHWDISGLSADRTVTLPATAAVGDRVGLTITTGDNLYEVLVTATAGDTLAGVAGGTEWSRLFITNETVTLRCIVANTTWIVEYDGRIPQQANMWLSTQTDLTQSASTWFAPTNEGGAWTADIDNASLCNVSTGEITFRRDCTGIGSIFGITRATPTTTKEAQVTLDISAGALTSVLLFINATATSTAKPTPQQTAQVTITKDVAIRFFMFNIDANIGAGEGAAGAKRNGCYFGIREVL